ncbi:VWA containing CoxE family domain protein [Mycobacterium xenopi 3993]|nr:VWA containing CoxE family domain protein [Mycobacterium xenopi 3993]
MRPGAQAELMAVRRVRPATRWPRTGYPAIWLASWKRFARKAFQLARRRQWTPGG